MKIKVGRNTDEFEIFDDKGNIVNLPVKEVWINLKPHEATVVRMTVYCDEIEIDANDNNVFLDAENDSMKE